MSQLLPEAELVVFESGAEVGGRLATLDIAGHAYEVGGSIIHPANREIIHTSIYSNSYLTAKHLSRHLLFWRGLSTTYEWILPFSEG